MLPILNTFEVEVFDMLKKEGKINRIDETFTAIDWLARLITHIPNKGEQIVNPGSLIVARSFKYAP